MTAPLVLLLAILILGSWMLFRYFEWRFVFEPSRDIAERPSDRGLEFEELRFVSADGNVLVGWWVPADDAPGTVLYCHGNGGNLGGRVEILEGLHRMGVHVFAFDYRGYGESRGLPTERGVHRDARAAYEVVRAKYGDTESPPIVLYGSSLGGAIAIHLARERKVRGLIVDGTFTSIQEMARLRFPRLPFHRLCTFGFNAARGIQDVSVPKLMAHSVEDEVIPFSHGEALFAAAGEPKTFVRLRGRHSEISWKSTSGFWDTFQTFVHNCLATDGPGNDPVQ